MSITPDILLRQGYRARREHRLADARQHFAEAVDMFRKADDRPLLAQALKGRGQIERDLKEIKAALQHYAEAVAIHRTLDDQLALAHTVRHMGDILREDEQPLLAAPCYEEALAIYGTQKATSSLDLANAIRGFALLKGDLGDVEAAKVLWQEARDLYAMVNVPEGVAESEAQIALLSGDQSPRRPGPSPACEAESIAKHENLK